MSILFPATVFSLLVAQQPTEATPLFRFEQAEIHMGTQFRIVAYAPNESTAETAFAAAFRRVKQLDKILSDYDPQSELSRLSSQAPTVEPVRVSDDLWSVLQQSQQISARTDGAFDITVGPLTKLWRRARRQKRLPSKDRLAEARAAVGSNLIRLHERNNAVELTGENMRLDLGGIAKGYAADMALMELRKRGIPCAMVDAGGDIVVGSSPPGEKGWKIGIRSMATKGRPERIISVANRAVATSGDAWQFVEIDGQRFSHIIDPKTGVGLTTRIAATVLADDCMTADALASAFCVLGPEKSIQLANDWQGVDAIIVVVRDGSVKTFRSSDASTRQTTK